MKYTCLTLVGQEQDGERQRLDTSRCTIQRLAVRGWALIEAAIEEQEVIILLLLFGNGNTCGCDNGCGCDNNNCGCGNNWWWIIILALLGVFGENGLGCGCDNNSCGCGNNNTCGCGC